MMKKSTIFISVLIIALMIIIPTQVFAMQIYVKPVDDNPITIEVENADTIESIKLKIQDKLEIMLKDQILFFEEKKLENERTLQDYNIQKDATIHLVFSDKIYKQYDIGSIIWYNPVTAKTCSKGEINCLEWNVLNEDTIYNTKLTLIAKQSLGYITPAIAKRKTVTGCYDSIGVFDERYVNEEGCLKQQGKTWYDNEEILIFNNIDELLPFISEKTRTWNDKLKLAKIYDGLDMTGYKARLMLESEASVIVGDNVLNRIYNFLLPLSLSGKFNSEEEIKNVLKNVEEKDLFFLTGKKENNYIKVLNLATGYKPDTLQLNVAFINYEANKEIQFKPIIELKKEWLINKNVSINNTSKDYISVDDDNPAVDSIVTIISKMRKGYILRLKIIDNERNELVVTNNTFIMPNSDVVISAEYEPIKYSFIEGQNAIYNGTDLAFKLDGKDSLVDKILVNGIDLDNVNYLSKEDGTIISLKNNYLETLEPGIYELEVIYTNGSGDKTTFKIKENQASDNNEEENPKTLDNLLFFVGLGSISLIGIISAGIYFKKYY